MSAERILAEIATCRSSARGYRAEASNLSAEGDALYRDLVDGYIAETPEWTEDGPDDPYRRANAELRPTWAEVERLDGVAAGLEEQARILEKRLARGGQ